MLPYDNALNASAKLDSGKAKNRVDAKRLRLFPDTDIQKEFVHNAMCSFVSLSRKYKDSPELVPHNVRSLASNLVLGIAVNHGMFGKDGEWKIPEREFVRTQMKDDENFLECVYYKKRLQRTVTWVKCFSQALKKLYMSATPSHGETPATLFFFEFQLELGRISRLEMEWSNFFSGKCVRTEWVAYPFQIV